MLVLRGLADWADAVAALPVQGPLPVRTVLVPHERQAHALRRRLLRTGRKEALAGTRFVGALTLAVGLLRAEGVEFTPGEEGLRRARLLALFEDVRLEYFDRDLLRSTWGWDEAFSRAIGDLEGAGLRPQSLPTAAARWRDVALLWHRLEASAGRSWTAARIYAEAAARLHEGAETLAGPALAAVTGNERATEARFLRALPGLVLALFAARPVRERHLERVEALYGREARQALEAAHGPPLDSAGAARPLRSGRTEPPHTATGDMTELDLLQRFLFASPQALADPERRRSGGPDGTVFLEEHSGVEAEVEAAADWVARQVLEARTPLEEIAVLVPVRDPLVGLVAERLGRLPWKDGALPVHVAGGVPAVSLAGGARALAVVRALEAHLAAEAVAAVLPGLRASLPDREHLSHGEAMDLAWSLGTVGGNGPHPAGALDWATRAAARESDLCAALGRARAEKDSEARGERRLERALERLRAARPALEALVGVARLAIENGSLGEMAEALGRFMKDWLLEPGQGARVSALLAESLEVARLDPIGSSLRGRQALETIEQRLEALRVPRGRFGEPAVFVGALSDAAGLDFSAMRVVGLCEGALPPPAREDPVLPDRARDEVGGPLLPAGADHVLARLHDFHRAIRGARRVVALSAPRTDLERTEREPSSIFVELGAALARPDAVTGEKAAAVPDPRSLRRDGFDPARRDSARFRARSPLSRAAWLDRAAACGEVPPSLHPLSPLERGEGRGEGPSGGKGSFGVPGLSPERPISASALQDLLRCPRYFLYRRVLGWDEPASAPPLGELDPLSYGNLFHRVMERFYREHGEDFVSRKKALGRWQELADEIAAELFAAFLSQYPLVGQGIREKERRRLTEDVRSFLAYDRDQSGPRRFVDVERSFGVPEALALTAGNHTLYVRGYIDRLDVEGDHTLVRDLKTGRPHPRTGDEAGPTPVRDVQLGLYGIVAKKLAPTWGLPAKVHAAYAYASDRGERERAFREDFGDLERESEAWLALAARILDERAFLPTPDGGDCIHCFFRPLCGEEAPARARQALDGEKGLLGSFRDFKLGKDQA